MLLRAREGLWAKRDQLASHVARWLGRPPYQDRLCQLIDELAPGRSLVDVGCMWRVDGAYAFRAVDRGATTVVGVDLRSATERFQQENAARQGAVRFVCGDVNDPTTVAAAGPSDIVFCSGVLYHVPNPALTLERLKALCRQTLVLGCATIPEQPLPQAAVYFPFLDEAGRRAVMHRTPPTHPKVGLDTPYVPEWEYSNYFWGMTPSCLLALLRTAGFEPARVFTWRRAVCIVARLA